MHASGVNAAIMHVIGKLERKKNERNRNCAHQTETRLVLNIWKNNNYNTDLVWFYKI